MFFSPLALLLIWLQIYKLENGEREREKRRRVRARETVTGDVNGGERVRTGGADSGKMGHHDVDVERDTETGTAGM